MQNEHLQKNQGGWGPLPSSLCALLHPVKRQPISFHSLVHSFRKMPGVGGGGAKSQSMQVTASGAGVAATLRAGLRAGLRTGCLTSREVSRQYAHHFNRKESRPSESVPKRSSGQLSVTIRDSYQPDTHEPRHLHTYGSNSVSDRQATCFADRTGGCGPCVGGLVPRSCMPG